jgi:hypothetical protein
MPKKQKRTEAEIHGMILRDSKMRLGCAEFAPDFTLHRTEVDATRYPSANWDIESARKVDSWAPNCAQAFKEAVATARRKFDIAWPL